MYPTINLAHKIEYFSNFMSNRKLFNHLTPAHSLLFRKNRAQFRICSPNCWPFCCFLSSFFHSIFCFYHKIYLYLFGEIIRFCCIAAAAVIVDVVVIVVVVIDFVIFRAYFFFLLVRARQKIESSYIALFSLKIINKIAHDFSLCYTTTVHKHNKQNDAIFIVEQ